MSTTTTSTISNTLVFFVNGRKVVDSEVEPSTSLVSYLRNKLCLPGTKLACGEGGCGACTVMVSRIDRKTNAIHHFSINACLAPVATIHGMAVTTVEGIGSTLTKLHPVQERISRSHGTQCGFCTPGMVMSMYTLLRNSPSPTMAQIEEYLTGNLCRCTGYRPIIEGYKTFSNSKGCGIDQCCQISSKSNKTTSKECSNINKNCCTEAESSMSQALCRPQDFSPYDPTQDIIFPPELKMMKQLDEEDLEILHGNVSFYRPTTLKKLLFLKEKYPHAKIIVGNTEVGIEVNFRNRHYPVLIYPSLITELTNIKEQETGLVIGASATLTDIEEELVKLIDKLPEYKTRTFKAIKESLNVFSGKQIRNAAAIGGNIMTGSPISDLNPILMAVGAVLTLKSEDEEREIKFEENFYPKYRENISNPKEVLVSIFVPYSQQNEHYIFYKQSRRRDDDVAIVNCGVSVKMKPGTDIVDTAVLAFGGLAPTVVYAKETMLMLHNKKWDKDLFESASDTLLHEFVLSPSAPGGMVNYRRTLAVSLFFKCYLSVQNCLHLTLPETVPPLTYEEHDITKQHKRPEISNTQLFQKVKEGQESIDPLGRPVPHSSSDQHATGEAVFVDDIPRYHNELSAAFVLTTKAKATLASIDCSEALAVPGVHSIISAKDITDEQNRWGPAKKDEEIFVSSDVKCIGQVIATVLADNPDIARRAAKLVNVTYTDIQTPIVTIQDAIAANSFYGGLKLQKGDSEATFSTCDHVLEGEIHIGGQEHFYMEPNAHIAVPHECQEMEIISSSQNLKVTQDCVASALGVSAHKVTCKIKRVGGGFGGKGTRTVMAVMPIAVAAAKIGRPVRVVLNRHEDMVMTGGRHPYLINWKIGFNRKGIIKAVMFDLFSNAGCTLDLSLAVLEKSLLTVDNVYNIDNILARGKVCKTNLPSNTAFRAFGTPQGSLVMEEAINNVAEYLQMSPNQVREKNMYTPEGCITHYYHKLTKCTIRQCWKEVLVQSKYSQLQQEVDIFNKKSRYRKRGISALPVKYGIAFTMTSRNQASALLLVYTDGSVLISHGGSEMGQGLHTKMIQIAAHCLQISADKIYIAETTTDKVPNASPSAASTCSDLFGGAVRNACEEINRRLSPIKQSLSGATWEEVVLRAYETRVSLSTVGFYKTEDINEVDWKTGRGNPFNYYTYGAAVSVVEIDCLTGHHQVLQTDIVMDVGTSLNPAVDIGQIEGAFTQGMGLFTLEELYYNPDGKLLTKGPGAYKIPGFQDIPCKFNISLLREASNPRAVYSSKGVGEPPLFLAATIFFAIKYAIKAARECQGIHDTFRLDSPATAERIRMACQDTITRKLKSPATESHKPWAVIV